MAVATAHYMTEAEIRAQLPEDARNCQLESGPIGGFLWPRMEAGGGMTGELDVLWLTGEGVLRSSTITAPQA